MITAKVVVDVTLLDNWLDYLDNIDTNLSLAGDRVENEIGDTLLDELAYEPPSAVLPIRWAPSRHPEDAKKSPNTQWGYYSRQKAAFFATDGFGAGIPTQRTGKIRNAWVIDTRTAKGRYTFRVRNPIEESKYVVGAINFKSRKAAVAPIQQFHINTGWQPAIDTISFWFDAVVEGINDRVVEDLQTTTTSKRRNR